MRRTHYYAHGGFTFDCYWAECNPWLEQQTRTDAAQQAAMREQGKFVAREDGAIPEPMKTTNLRKVTCAKCWHEIMAMARKHLLPVQKPAPAGDEGGKG